MTNKPKIKPYKTHNTLDFFIVPVTAVMISVILFALTNIVQYENTYKEITAVFFYFSIGYLTLSIITFFASYFESISHLEEELLTKFIDNCNITRNKLNKYKSKNKLLNYYQANSLLRSHTKYLKN